VADAHDRKADIDESHTSADGASTAESADATTPVDAHAHAADDAGSADDSVDETSETQSASTDDTTNVGASDEPHADGSFAGADEATASTPTAEPAVEGEHHAADVHAAHESDHSGDVAEGVAQDGTAAHDVETATDVEASNTDDVVTPADEDHADGVTSDTDDAAATEPVDGADDAGEGVDAVATDEAAVEDDDDFKRPVAEVKAIVEALIFASPDPLTPKSLLKLLDNEPKEDVLAALDELRRDYERPCGLQFVEVAGGFQIVTRADLHEWVRRLFHERSTQKLSAQALETLAVIAYRQPITAIEITEIRGVNTSGVLNTLLERHLVKIVGRKQVVGRPFMYATTKEFLIRFGLKDLADLPKVEDMAESLGIESRLLIEQTPPEEQLPLSEPETDDLPYEASPDEEPPTDDDTTVH